MQLGSIFNYFLLSMCICCCICYQSTFLPFFSMSFLELVFLALIIYFLIYVLLWLLLDCNVSLWYYDRFGGVALSSLRGQVVWITGASSGIGKHLALNLARHGVRLVLSARREALLGQVKQECLEAADGLLAEKDVLVICMDMLKMEHHEQHLEHVLQHFGKLDILVNNAGRSQRAAWEEIDVRVDRELFELDVFAVMHLSRLVVRYFLQHGHGHLVATSSLAGVGLAPFSATYCAAKHALNAYFMALRLEHPHLDVTIFAPGPIATDFLQEAFTALPEGKVGESTANQKRMTADRCAKLFAVSIANKMQLTWCGLFPVNALGYVMQQPTLSRIFMGLMGRQTMSKIREGKL